MPATDFRKLVRECLKNKRTAQKELYEHFAPDMLGVCFRYTKNIQDAENILQDGFIRVFKHLGKYRGDGELGGWIRRIMVNSALNYLKKNKQYRSELAFEEINLHPVSEDHPDVKLAKKELASLIRQLPTGYQTIFNLFAVEGYSHVEIGRMLGISEGTSRSQYARARNLLIEWLKQISEKEKGGRYGK